jgi:predicted Rossmann-fold nucleotide-binding protein
VVLFGSDYWSGLITWLRDTVARQGKIDNKDMTLFQLTDDPDEVVRIILDARTKALK